MAFATVSFDKSANVLPVSAINRVIDSSSLLLALGRHAGIQPDSHSPTARTE